MLIKHLLKTQYKPVLCAKTAYESASTVPLYLLTKDPGSNSPLSHERVALKEVTVSHSRFIYYLLAPISMHRGSCVLSIFISMTALTEETY